MDWQVFLVWTFHGLKRRWNSGTEVLTALPPGSKAMEPSSTRRGRTSVRSKLSFPDVSNPRNWRDAVPLTSITSPPTLRASATPSHEFFPQAGVPPAATRVAPLRLSNDGRFNYWPVGLFVMV